METQAKEKEGASEETRDLNVGYHQFVGTLKKRDEGQREQLEWFWGYLTNEIKGNREAAEQALKMTWSEIYKVLTGHDDEETLETFLEANARLRKLEEAKRTTLIKTCVVKRIIEAFDYARDTCSMVSVIGSTGRSKTFTALWWAAENNHGRTTYVRVPSSGTRRAFVTALCAAKGISKNKKTSLLESRLFSAFGQRNMIIVDEAGHLLSRVSKSTGAYEIVRDLHDICGCAIGLIFTDVYFDDMRSPELVEYHEQFLGRMKYIVRIPPLVRRDEVRALVANFKPNPSEALVDLALRLARERDGKLRTLCEDLQGAMEFARNKHREMSVEDLKISSAWRKNGSYWAEDK